MSKTIISIGFLIRILVAVWNGFFGPSFGADLDAEGFHLAASDVSKYLEFSEFSIGTMPYVSYLGFFYWLITDSLFMGSFLSCIAWLVSATILLKTLKIFDTHIKHICVCMLIYSFLPSSLMYTSVTLREVYQLLFVNIAVYSALMIYINKSFIYWFSLFIGCFGSSLLHGALMMFSVMLFSLTIFFLFTRSREKMPWLKIILISPFVMAIMITGLSIFTQNSYNLDNGFINSVENFQGGALNSDGRTIYKNDSNINGILGLLLFVPVSFYQYLFEPMPWRISSSVDVPVVLENILRVWLIWIAFKGFKTMPPNKYRPVLFVFIAYILLEAIWSIGTINWGTASRHHIPSMGMLLIAAFANIQTKK